MFFRSYLISSCGFVFFLRANNGNFLGVILDNRILLKARDNEFKKFQYSINAK